MTGLRRTLAVAVVVLAAGTLLGGAYVTGPAPVDSAAGNVTATTTAGVQRTPVATQSTAGQSITFREVSDEVGFNFTKPHALPGISSSAGVYAADYNNDGWTDLLAVGGGSRPPTLFENRGGTFHRVASFQPTDAAVKTAIFLDYDVDGWQDLILFPFDSEPILLENRAGTFVEVEAGLNVTLAMPQSASAGDVNGDGCPDLFVAQYRSWETANPRGQDNFGMRRGTDNGRPNVLFAGRCGGGFENVTSEAGISGARWSLTTAVVDFTRDGRPDLYVGNDFNHDVLYVNRGDGTFEQVLLSNETARNAMAAEVADFDGDGHPDVFVTNIYFPPSLNERLDFTGERRAQGNTLLLNRPGASFAERAKAYGVRKGGWGWAAVATDFDNDRDVDIFHATGQFTFPLVVRGKAVRNVKRKYSFYEYPVFYEQSEIGTTPFFRWDASKIGFEATQGRGAAGIDYDNDGDREIALAVSGGQYRLYDVALDGNNALQVDLQSGPNGTALGARVAVSAGGETQYRYHNARTDYLSQDSRVIHVGLGEATRADVTVTWPDGTVRTFENVAAGQRLVITRAGVVDRIPLDGPVDRGS